MSREWLALTSGELALSQPLLCDILGGEKSKKSLNFD